MRRGGAAGPAPGLYLHIPYCRRKCAYCAFNSVETKRGVPSSYMGALLKDIVRSAAAWDGAEFATVYLGGGTPSLLGPGDAARILRALRTHFTLMAGAEVTLEANPSSLSRRDLDAYLEAGVNRLSVGAQSLSRSELALLGRLHSPGEAAGALKDARAAGFARLSCDVMVAVPGQTEDSLMETLAGLAPLAGHVSCYLLSLEPGTPLSSRVAAGELMEQREEDVILLFHTVERELGVRGFARYELSNWCLPGHECAHNQAYWRRGDYLGLGAGAASHREGLRQVRIRDPVAYAGALNAGLSPVGFEEALTREQMLLEEVMLGLRTSRGLDLERLRLEFGCDLAGARTLLSGLISTGLLLESGRNIQLSARGMMVSDAIAGDLASSLTCA